MSANPLAAEIRRRISNDGPMSYATFMQLALYHPEHGFYMDPARGPGADYRTSPELTPAFGEMIARQVERMWHALEEPDRFSVLEIGGGRGELAEAVLRHSPPDLPLEWVFVERSSRLRAGQQQRFNGNASVSWRISPPDGPAIVGLALANEVLDNFPVHLCQVGDEESFEVLIDSREGRLVEVLGPPSSTALVREMQTPAAHLETGDRFEICLGLRGLCQEVSTALQRGYMLVVDYGEASPAIWTSRPSGSLVSYRNEMMSTDVLEEPGEADITSHVDFSRLTAAAESAGFAGISLLTQAEFLESLGIKALTEGLRNAERRALAERPAEALSLMAERSRLHLLRSRPGLGDLKVFLAAKSAPSAGAVI